MFDRIVAMCLGIAAARCGGDVPAPPSEQPTGVFDPRLIGTFSADFDVMETKYERVSFRVDLQSEERDGNLVMGPFCPDGTGSMTMTGAGRDASWTGGIDCASPTPSCPSRRIGYTQGFVSVVNGSEVHGSFGGIASGCGSERPLTVRFIGRR